MKMYFALLERLVENVSEDWGKLDSFTMKVGGRPIHITCIRDGIQPVKLDIEVVNVQRVWGHCF